LKKSTIQRQRIRTAIWLILMVFAFGVLGYMFLEDYSFLDALYMTVITLSTIGFGLLRELTSAGKLFTIFLIIVGLGTFGYMISLVTSYFVEGQLEGIVRGYFKKSDIKKMKNHVIICGYGRNGRQAVDELHAHNVPCVVVDNKGDKFEYLEEEHNMKFINGDATSDEVLRKAGIKGARALITTLPVDADNVYVVLSARFLNEDVILISRASNETVENKLHVAGVNSVVMPEKVGGAHMAKLVANPDVVEFLEHLSIDGLDPTNLEEIVCSDMPPDIINQRIDQIGIRKRAGANIIGFKTPEGKYIINPPPETRVIHNSKLFVLGTPNQIKAMKEMMQDKS